MRKGVVLSGGGGKGAYQVGVWKALRKINYNYDVVTGTSIGALNGLMMVQNRYKQCLKLWETINFDQIYEGFEQSSENIYHNYASTILKKGLIETNKIAELIAENYNSNKVYQKDYGVVAYNLTKKKQVLATTKNTKPEELQDYIIASATCFPVFRPKKIATDEYIDGGYYDNLPINLAIELGAEEIVAVDLKSIGLKRFIKNKKIKVTYIAPHNKLESFLLFDGNKNEAAINFGYNDTLKAFKHLDGDYYTFKKNNLLKNYNKYYPKYLEKINEDIPGLVIKLFDAIISDKKSYETFNYFIENLGKIFQLKEDKIYHIWHYNHLLIKKLKHIELIDLEKDILEKKDIKKLFNEQLIVKYIYHNIVNRNDKIIKILMVLYPLEYLSALYLVIISRR